jgi:hypothetical protein
MRRLSRLTITQLFVLTTMTAAVAVSVTFYGVLESSRRSIIARSDVLRDQAAHTIGSKLSAELGVAVTTTTLKAS